MEYVSPAKFVRRQYCCWFIFLFITCSPGLLSAQITGDTLTTYALKKLSLEQLMNIQVTSASRMPEKVVDAPSAIKVITDDDIRRFGVMRIPEALQLAGNLQVAQINTSSWAISARGFNNVLANKLLVLIDGRAVYSPLFAGVFWQIQDVFIKDVKQIEAISGPGATLWGSNAVNGIINITSKKAAETQGLYLEAAGGTEIKNLTGLRYGGSIGSTLHYRVYGKYTNIDGNVHYNGNDASNDWREAQGGFRIDWNPSYADFLTLQGDVYDDKFTGPEALWTGGNILSRWVHTISASSGFQLQVYYDRFHSYVPMQYRDVLKTYDLDFQHNFLFAERNSIVWGLGYKLVQDDFIASTIMLVPQKLSLRTYNGFIQDEIALVNDKLFLTLGSKFEHNEYTGFEYQPTARLFWKIASNHSIWTAISRAVRIPSRLDHDYLIPGVVSGNPDFKSEKLIAYEMGYRTQPANNLGFGINTYYNIYDNIRSIEKTNQPATTPFIIGNGFEGKSAGMGFTAVYIPVDWWRIRVGINEIFLTIKNKPGSTDLSGGSAEAADSKHFAFIKSSVNILRNLELSIFVRYVSKVINRATPDYGEMNIRLGWQLTPMLELSFVGNNLLHKYHSEFGPINSQKVERSVYGKISFSM